MYQFFPSEKLSTVEASRAGTIQLRMGDILQNACKVCLEVQLGNENPAVNILSDTAGEEVKLEGEER